MLIGRFYFTLTPAMNLLGEYSNNSSQRCLTEAANRIVEGNDTNERAISRFVGDYESVWREPSGESINALLRIRAKPQRDGIFTLEWLDLEGTRLFHGEGMMFGDSLIGDCRQQR